MSSKIGERVKSIRGELNQRDFAGRLGVSKGSISQIEQGKAMPSGEFLVKIHAAYGVDVTWLLTGMSSQPTAGQYADAVGKTGEDAARDQEWTVADQLRWQEERGIHIPHEPALTPDEELLLAAYRGMAPAKRKALLNLLTGK